MDSMALRPLGEFLWRRIAGVVVALVVVAGSGAGWAQDATTPADEVDEVQQRLVDEATQLAYVPPTNIVGQPDNWRFGLQSAASPVAEQMQGFHTLLLVIIFAIAIFVLGLLVYVMRRFSASRNPTPSKTAHNTTLEVVWTVVPVIILLIIVFPSMAVLYFMDRTEDPEMTLVVQGYQWNWGYEYPDQRIEEFISNPVPDAEITGNQVRMLSTTDPVVLPVDTNIQVLVTAGDVLHSWSVPAFGIRTDAVPGRMNETWVRIEEEGIYFGQCYELCGVFHSFMPVEVHAVSREMFNAWVVTRLAEQGSEEAPRLLPPVEDTEPAVASLQGTDETHVALNNSE